MLLKDQIVSKNMLRPIETLLVWFLALQRKVCCFDSRVAWAYIAVYCYGMVFVML